MWKRNRRYLWFGINTDNIKQLSKAVTELNYSDYSKQGYDILIAIHDLELTKLYMWMVQSWKIYLERWVIYRAAFSCLFWLTKNFKYYILKNVNAYIIRGRKKIKSEDMKQIYRCIKLRCGSGKITLKWVKLFQW